MQTTNKTKKTKALELKSTNKYVTMYIQQWAMTNKLQFVLHNTQFIIFYILSVRHNLLQNKLPLFNHITQSARHRSNVQIVDNICIVVYRQ